MYLSTIDGDKTMIIKRHILKHQLLELPNTAKNFHQRFPTESSNLALSNKAALDACSRQWEVQVIITITIIGSSVFGGGNPQ